MNFLEKSVLKNIWTTNYDIILDNGLREDYKQELDPFGIKDYIMNQNP